ncbi:uncharacterized protein N7459_000921 [Penicillium hispanicum]|uniref:uncharacterized protein n=1 Tax=Penicillium hispanicum TaxID=1080232 RepID=UPI0025415EE5|nr:uncharacterized protein N7459_000921 [Penicillium hispanicum]KAJ5594713.1 hypothetical protein N7459_000921 [Penicillium hispanicum]
MQVEYTPYGGDAANETGCSNIRNQKFTFTFDTILAITERDQYNLGNNPVNAFLVVWPENGPLYLDSEPTNIADNQWSLFSSTPDYTATAVSYVKPNFNLTLEKTQQAPYNLSSTLTSYYGETPLDWNMTNCNSSDVVKWTGNLINQKLWKSLGFNTSYPDPVLSMQFDAETANLTIDGYFESTPVGNASFNEDGLAVPGKIHMSFSGSLDAYHSDDLVNNSATPVWLKTVGFQNNSQNIGYNHSKSGATESAHGSGVWALAASVLALSVATLYI